MCANNRQIDMREADTAVQDLLRKVLTAMLGIPNKLKRSRPEMTREQLGELDSLIRRALEALAREGAARMREDAATKPSGGLAPLS